MPTLYVVATPIGNLGDMSPRAVETLKSVALIAAEDTRVTRKLLSVFEIQTPLTSCHEHNERDKAVQIVQRMLTEGIDVAVTTDAGTPCISDPGSGLVAKAARAGIEIVAVAGPTAMAAALSVSGITLTEFTFNGFLPRQKGELQKKLLEMATRSQVAVVHESPHRVAALLESVLSVLPNTYVSASCDLTKRYELTLRGTVSEVLEGIRLNPKSDKGEYCLVFQWHDTVALEESVQTEKPSLEARLFDRVLSGATLRDAMDDCIAGGERKNAVYAAALRVKALLREDECDG